MNPRLYKKPGHLRLFEKYFCEIQVLEIQNSFATLGIAVKNMENEGYRITLQKNLMWCENEKLWLNTKFIFEVQSFECKQPLTLTLK